MGRKKKLRKRKKSSSKNIFPLAILLILGLFIYFFINFKGIANFVSPRSSSEQLISAKSLGNIRLTPPPPTPTPTAIPTPTPVPLVGYCLNVPVLMYHHIQPDAEAKTRGQTALSVDSGQFDLQMGYLVGNGYSIISAQQLVDSLIGHAQVPSKSIVITMDDGYNDIYQYAYPVLQKYHIIANLMIPTGLLGGADYLSWGQLEEMTRSGLVFAGDHTWSHYAITNGPQDKINYEIATAKQQLQEHTGQNIDIFTYPYGVFSASAISALKQNGIIGAFSEIWGHWQCDSFIMALHRTRIGNAPLSYYGL